MNALELIQEHLTFINQQTGLGLIARPSKCIHGHEILVVTREKGQGRIVISHEPHNLSDIRAILRFLNLEKLCKLADQGIFDRRFFAYLEAYRMKDGYKVIFAPMTRLVWLNTLIRIYRLWKA